MPVCFPHGCTLLSRSGFHNYLPFKQLYLTALDECIKGKHLSESIKLKYSKKGFPYE